MPAESRLFCARDSLLFLRIRAHNVRDGNERSRDPLNTKWTDHDRAGGAGRGLRLFRFVVLASTWLARISRRNSRRSTLAMAGGTSVGAGIVRGPPLRLG